MYYSQILCCIILYAKYVPILTKNVKYNGNFDQICYKHAIIHNMNHRHIIMV